MELSEIRTEIFEKLGNYRSTYAWLYRDDFLYLWQNSNDDERLAVGKYALKGDILGVRRWIKHHRLTDISEWTQVDIVEEAKSMHIQGIYLMSKQECVEAIKSAKRRNDSKNQRDVREDVLPDRKEQSQKALPSA